MIVFAHYEDQVKGINIIVAEGGYKVLDEKDDEFKVDEVVSTKDIIMDMINSEK